MKSNSNDLDRQHVLRTLRSAPPVGLRPDEIAVALGLDDKGKHRLRRMMGDLLDEGIIEKTAGSRYQIVGLPSVLPAMPAESGVPPEMKPGWVAGSLRVHPSGFAFVARDDKEDDVFVAARYRGLAFDGDRVAVSTWTGHKGTEGKVEAVLSRGRAKLTGILVSEGGRQRLEPDDPRIAATSSQIYIESAVPGGNAGLSVVVEVVRWPTTVEGPMMAKISHILGDPEDPRTEVEKALIGGDIAVEFPEEVLAAATNAPTVVRPEDLVDRVDLRAQEFLTIDPETARDFDDAICVEKSPKAGHMRLYVAVADVSHYVRVGEPLDDEARRRGCSVYLPDRAIPMLPRQLSSDICSLNPEVDRLAMVVRMEVDANGGVVDPYFCAAVIRSRSRMDYAGVAHSLAGETRGPLERYQPWLPTLRTMQELAGRLRKVRTARGALDFELPEAKVILDEDDPRRVRDVVQSRGDVAVKGAYQMIEDFMLAANEAVARFFGSADLDTVWRVHDVPTDERLEAFSQVAEAYGVHFDPIDGRDPKKVRELMAVLEERPAAVKRALHFLLLRALKQAQYDIVNVGHFGLGAKDYLHFTSPIRRYPDLIVHRLLKTALSAAGVAAGGKPGPAPLREELAAMALESSRAERRAMEVEREVVDMYRAFLMRDHVGEEYEGTIAGVASFGVFVQIDSPFVEGLVKLEELGEDYWEYDAEGMRIVGRGSGRSFSMGDSVRVEIMNVSVQRRKIDMRLLEHTQSHFALPRPRSSQGRGGRASEKARPGVRSRGGSGRPQLPVSGANKPGLKARGARSKSRKPGAGGHGGPSGRPKPKGPSGGKRSGEKRGRRR